MAQFSDTTYATTGLIQLCEDHCSLGSGGISGNSTLLKQFTNYLNIALSDVWSEILSVNKQVRPDDLNYTDYPDAPIALVASQADYTVPVAATGANVDTFAGIKGIYYTKNGYKVYLRPMEESETLFAVDGVPSAYRLNGQSIFLNIQPSSAFVTDVTNLHVEFKRSPSFFASTDTTKHPGFLVAHHPLLALKASSIYLRPVDLQTSRQLSSGREDIPGDYESGLKKLRRDYIELDESQESNITSEAISFR